MDTVLQLRELAKLHRTLMDGHSESVCNTAADEIERLVRDCRSAVALILRGERQVSAMQAEANKWARIGWRDIPEQDARIAEAHNEAAEAILAALRDVTP